ncbi:MAG: hypothetical protein HUK24_05105 [Sphaerochaetaceae bacterium]|nr:hypothetical protein [Sphaerochaetaceae bacterium]
MRCSCEGIMYPYNAKSTLRDLNFRNQNNLFTEIPHSSWDISFPLLLEAFAQGPSSIKGNIVILCPLHKGKICFDDSYKVYIPENGLCKGSDWDIEINTPSDIINDSFLRDYIEISNDVCSEEHGPEILFPLISRYYPNNKVTIFLAPQSKNIKEELVLKTIVEKLVLLFPQGRFFISNNIETNCAAMWLKAIKKGN